jgi:hypothetical protein
MIFVCLFLVCNLAFTTANGQEDDGVLMAAVAAAGPNCDACPVDGGVVCADLPTVRGVRQTVMSRCLAECQGFKNINEGACEGDISSGVTISAGESLRVAIFVSSLLIWIEVSK